MNETATIPAQFNGPPGSGNGGYAAGAFAEFLEGAAEVTLRSPPPLGQPMQVVRKENGLVVRDGETLVGEVRPCTLSLDVPDCPDAGAVRTAVRRFVEFKKDDFHRCFVGGAERALGDGLCLRTGTIDGSEVVATKWIPHENFAGTNGLIPQRILWSALDCPGVWSIIRDTGVVMHLGRLTAVVDIDVVAGTPCTVIGWPMGRDGRKAYAGTAIYDANDSIRGQAKSVWIDIGEQV